MYIVLAWNKLWPGRVDYYGPFQTEDRAKEYAGELPELHRYKIEPLIVPNCVGVTFATKY